MQMESQLAAFRERRYKSNKLNNNPIDIRTARTSPAKHQDEPSKEAVLIHKENEQTGESPTLEDPPVPTTKRTGLIILQLVIWSLLWLLFIKLEFGCVYFILSIPVFIYKNLGKRSPKSKAPSAYSVFNPDCERIDGTFTAEQFEKELRYGALHVH